MILTIADRDVFEALADGSKRYEGRRWKDAYEVLKPGSYLIFLLEGDPELLVTVVEEVRRYTSIEKMVEELWKELLPMADGVDTAKKYYNRFYSLNDPAVAIRVRPLVRERIGERELKKWLRLGLLTKS